MTSPDRIEKLAVDVRRKIEGDPAWRRKDARSRWICPCCGEAQESVSLASPEAMFEKAPALAARHLLLSCKRGPPEGAKGSSAAPRVAKKSAAVFQHIDESALDKREAQKEPSGLGSASSSGAKAAEKASFADYRREIERELEQVRAQVPGSSVGNALPLEDTQHADAEESSRVAERMGFELRFLIRASAPPRGDFVEALRLDGNRLGLILGGVTGEDQDASLVAAMARNLLRIAARRETDPAQALRRVNAEVFEDLGARSFVSAGFAILDGSKRRVAIARAGLTPPLLSNPRREPAFVAIEPEGMVMGIDKGPIFDAALETRTLELSAGDLLVFATNGLLEVRGGSPQEELGRERFHETVRRYGRHEAEYLVHKLGQSLEEFSRDGAQGADICVAALRLPPPA
ncbi:serine/threonine-protein phosphatase [bacterium]|nr:serine/threonine-protein phosphatase [bacterium]